MRDIETDIIDFLGAPQNLGLAFDIWERFPKVRDNLVIGFWNDLVKLLKNKMEQSEEITDWLIISEAKNDEQWLSRCQIVIQQASADAAVLNRPLRFIIEQNNPSSTWYGINWSGVAGKWDILSSPAVSKLWDSLRLKGFKNDLSGNVYVWVQPQLASKPGLLSICEGRLAERISNEFWDLFQEYRESVAEANSDSLK